MSVIEKVHYLDRKVTNTSTGVSSVFKGGETAWLTAWTLPYELATDGTEGTLRVCQQSPPLVFPEDKTTRPQKDQVAVEGYGDLTQEDVYIGVVYDFKFEYDAPYLRDRNGQVVTGGRLTTRFVEALLEASTDLEIEVEIDGESSPSSYVFGRALPTDDAELNASVHARNETALIRFKNTTPGGHFIVGLDWEGSYTRRNRKV